MQRDVWELESERLRQRQVVTIPKPQAILTGEVLGSKPVAIAPRHSCGGTRDAAYQWSVTLQVRR